ncbi:MAG: ABC transporter ATP-binding protein [Spirochaetales bacterium]|jgi:ABC-2 type transport system ATP-binding protein|nr:ABC transporter ATP-binding protein [Spirochaetales bacterium]
MIIIKDLKFGYAKKPLFQELKLNLKPGIYGLLGKNGAGKSSLLKLMAGLLYPQGGECFVLDSRPRDRRPALLEEIFLIGEEFFLPPLPMKEYIRLYSPFYPRFDREFLEHALEEWELPREGILTKMSYGQQKKFLLAFGLAAETKILLLDEPTNGLDIPSKTQFRRLLAGHWAGNRCILISTHQVKDVEQLIERALIVDRGRIIFNHTLQESAGVLKTRLSGEDPGEGVLYREKTLGGWASLEKASGGPEPGLDLELLFNGVLSAPEKFNALFEEA